MKRFLFNLLITFVVGPLLFGVSMLLGMLFIFWACEVTGSVKVERSFDYSLITALAFSVIGMIFGYKESFVKAGPASRNSQTEK